MKPAIIAIGYNRADSLARLLDSLSNATYEYDDIPLIISIDHSKKEYDEANIRVVELAKSFVWNHGRKEVIYREKNMGLRPHIVACGDLVNTYGSVIMLEDDIYVSPVFYKYACQALEFSADKDYISGISLYNHRMNFQTKEMFYPLEDGFDNWYLKFPQSWGQAWTANQWNGFKKWYDMNSATPPSGDGMPASVASWPETSWMKYYLKYMISSNKFHFYPKHSLTTNFCDAGTNASVTDVSFQVPVIYKSTRPFIFSDISESVAVYDQFFENVNLYKHLGLPWDKLTVDLYGHKPLPSSGYLLSRKQLEYKIEKSFACLQRPMDINIINNHPGRHFHLYNLSEKAQNKFTAADNIPVPYFFKGLSRKNQISIIKYFIKSILISLKSKILKLTKK